MNAKRNPLCTTLPDNSTNVRLVVPSFTPGKPDLPLIVYVCRGSKQVIWEYHSPIHSLFCVLHLCLKILFPSSDIPTCSPGLGSVSWFCTQTYPECSSKIVLQEAWYPLSTSTRGDQSWVRCWWPGMGKVLQHRSTCWDRSSYSVLRRANLPCPERSPLYFDPKESILQTQADMGSLLPFVKGWSPGWLLSWH